MKHEQSAAGVVGRVDVEAAVSGWRDRQRAACDVDALLARVDLDAYADELLAVVEREVPAIAALDGDVRRSHVRSILRNLGALAVHALGHGPASTREIADFAEAATDLGAVWGLSVDDFAIVVSLSGSVLAEQLFDGLSSRQVLVLVDGAARGAGVVDLFGRVIAAAVLVWGASDVDSERSVRRRLGGARPDGPALPAVAGAQRCFVARIPGAPVRAHAALARALRDGGIDAATGSDHVFGMVAAGAAVPSADGVVVVTEAQARDADVDTRRRWLLEVADAADRIGVRGALSDRDLVVHRLLIADPRRRASLAGRLARVSAGGSAVLEAAKAFVHGGSVAAAAAALGLHRETVRSRVKRAGRLAGLDLTTLSGRSTLALAIVASSLGDARHDLRPIAVRGRGSVAEPAFARVDLAALTNRAVEILTRRALAAGLDGDVDEVRPARVRDGLVEAMRLLQQDVPYPRVELTVERKRRLGQLTLGLPLVDAPGAFAEVLSVLVDALVSVGTREEKVTFPRVIARQWACPGVLYETIRSRGQGGASRTDALRELLELLVTGSAPRHVLASRAHAAGLDIDERYRALVVDVAEKATTASAFAMTLRAAGWAAVSDGRVVQALVAAHVSDARLRTLLLDSCVACASEVAALGDLGGAIPPLRRLVVAVGASGRRGLLDPDEEVIALLLLQRPDLATLLRQRVHAVLHDRSSRADDLIATLTIYVDSGMRRGPTAEALHIHPNSVDYRLRTIEALTGLSLTNADDVLVLSLAVTAERFAAARDPVDLVAAVR